jgi:hypothetical protein
MEGDLNPGIAVSAWSPNHCRQEAIRPRSSWLLEGAQASLVANRLRDRPAHPFQGRHPSVPHPKAALDA